MASITLDEDNNATEAPYRHGPGYVAEGIVFDREKLVNIFDAYGPQSLMRRKQRGQPKSIRVESKNAGDANGCRLCSD